MKTNTVVKTDAVDMLGFTFVQPNLRGYGVMGLWGYGVMGLWGYGVMGQYLVFAVAFAFDGVLLVFRWLTRPAGRFKRDGRTANKPPDQCLSERRDKQ